jgi:hypothetical protein
MSGNWWLVTTASIPASIANPKPTWGLKVTTHQSRQISLAAICCASESDIMNLQSWPESHMGNLRRITEWFS